MPGETAQKRVWAATMWADGALTQEIAEAIQVGGRWVYRWISIWQGVRLGVPYEVLAHRERVTIRDIQRLVKAAVEAGLMMPGRRMYQGVAMRLDWN